MNATGQAIEALESAITMCELQGDKPGQLRWHVLSDQLTAALAALRAQPDHSDLIKRLNQPQDFYNTFDMSYEKTNALYRSLMQDAADALERAQAIREEVLK